MNVPYFLTMLAAVLVGGVAGRYLANRLRVNNTKPLLRIRWPAAVERALIVFVAFLVVFTLFEDIAAVTGADWDLWIVDDREMKYGFLLGVVLVSLVGDFMDRRKQSDERAARAGPAGSGRYPS